MSGARPQNVGLKAFEIYIPNQVRRSYVCLFKSPIDPVHCKLFLLLLSLFQTHFWRFFNQKHFSPFSFFISPFSLIDFSCYPICIFWLVPIFSFLLDLYIFFIIIIIYLQVYLHFIQWHFHQSVPIPLSNIPHPFIGRQPSRAWKVFGRLCWKIHHWPRPNKHGLCQR